MGLPRYTTGVMPTKADIQSFTPQSFSVILRCPAKPGLEGCTATVLR